MRIKWPDRFNLVPKKVNANGELGSRWEKIEDAAAARELTRFGNEGGRFKPVLNRPLEKLVLRHTVAGTQNSSRRTQCV
jgi:hypothetical protein